MAGAGFEPVKDEAKTRAGFIAIGNGSQAFIKRFDSGSRARGLLARVRGSRARRSVQGAALLRSHGFRCPEPYAALEVRSAGSVGASYLISEALRGARVFSVFVGLLRRFKGPQARWRGAVLASVAKEIRRLHDAGLFSSDLQETNLMLEEVDGEIRIYFVDLDRFRHVAQVRRRLRERNLVQLDRSIGRFLDRSARLRFLYAYLGGRPERRKARELVARLLKNRAEEDRRQGSRRARQGARPDCSVESALPR